MGLEKHSEKTCRLHAEAAGFRLWKLVPVVRGLPDRLLIGPRRTLVFIEMKRSDGALSEHQVRMHERLRAWGFRVETCYSIAEFDAILESVRS